MKDVKIACYGFVDKDSGSGGKAHFFILEELAKRNVKIDFFGWRGFNRAEELQLHAGFRYIDLPSSRFNSFMDKLPTKLKSALFPIVNMLFMMHFILIRCSK
ncbi:MAG: hypothetical protein HC799_20075 [Limnothrix sp. RL_2_0]|nr:hypothetical protein [Limnothrix sp. RL_2_0]